MRAGRTGIGLQDVGLEVKRLQWRHHRESNRRLAAVDLSLAQWDVLRHLSQQPDASLHDLAVLTFQSDQSMGSLAARMLERGLIERVAGAGRAVRHRLTAAGTHAFEHGGEVLEGMLGETLGALSDAELQTLHALLLRAGSSGPATHSVGTPT